MVAPAQDLDMAAPTIRAQVDAAFRHALMDDAHVLLGLRIFVTTVALPVFALCLLAGGERGWRLWALGFVELTLLASVALDRRRPRPFSARRTRTLMVLVLLLHTVIIATSGGVESPFLPVYIPVTVVLAVAVGRGRAFALNLGVLAAVAATFLVLRLTLGALEVPSALRLGPAAPADALYLGLVVGFVVLFMLVGGLVGLRLRARLDAAALEVATARAETLDAVQTRNRELSTLSSALAHELKNPLAAIQSLSGLVARRLPADSREAEHMSVLIGEVHRLGGVLDEFLNLSRPADGLNTAPTDPAELVEGVARLYTGAGGDRGLRIVVELGPCGPVRCDPRKIRQVLINLVENALHHAAEGGQVTLGLAEHDGLARFTVDDDGAGLAPEAARRAFEAGFTTRAEGTGLGLTVARAIAHQHDGDLTLTDRPGGGARATLTLPREAP